MAHNHEVAGSSPAPATNFAITSVVKTEVFVCPKSPKKLVDSGPAWSILLVLAFMQIFI